MGKRRRRAVRNGQAEPASSSARPRGGGDHRGRSGGGPRPDLEQVVWRAVAATQRRAPDSQVWLDAVAGHGRPAVAMVRSLLRQAAADLSVRGWSDDDVRHVADRRLSRAHTEVILDGHPLPLEVAAPVAILIEALAFVTSLPDVPAPPANDAEHARLGGLDPKMLSRVRALLNQAESTEFQEEAEALTAKAQKLIARHAIDAVLLGSDADLPPTRRRVYLDDPYAEAKSVLLSRVAAANRCTSVFSQAFNWSDVFGFPGDLDATELLAQSLLAQATQAMAREGSRTDAVGRSRTRSFRRSFLVGFAIRIGERLQRTTDASVTAAGADNANLLPALVRRDERVEALQAHTYPRTVGRSMSISNGSGWVAGRAAADVADLHVGTGMVTE